MILETAVWIALKLGVLLGRHFTSLEWGAASRVHVYTPFSRIRNGWMDCAENWHAVRDPIDKRLTENPLAKRLPEINRIII